MVRKTYRHRSATIAEITVQVDGSPVKVNFSHGYHYPKRVNGFINTEDKKLQKAIEEHSLYNDRFYLEKVNGEFLEKKAENPAEEELRKQYDLLKDKYETLLSEFNSLAAEHERLKLKKDEEVIEPIKPESTNITLTTIKVKNYQEAKEILKAEPYNVATNKMPSEKAILNRAAELFVAFEIV